MFIDETDLQGKMDATILSRITNDDETIVTTANKFVEDTLKNKLGARYNMTIELGKSGDARDGTLLEYALNLAVFRIYERIQDLDVPDRIVKLYDDTLTDLDKINEGKTSLSSLTKTLDTDGNKKTRFYYGSTEKRDNNPF